MGCWYHRSQGFCQEEEVRLKHMETKQLQLQRWYIAIDPTAHPVLCSSFASCLSSCTCAWLVLRLLAISSVLPSLSYAHAVAASGTACFCFANYCMWTWDCLFMIVQKSSDIPWSFSVVHFVLRTALASGIRLLLRRCAQV